jgi:transposase
MLSLPLPVKIFWRKEHTDLRKSFDGLAAIVREELGHDPFSGHLFIFASKRRKRYERVPA